MKSFSGLDVLVEDGFLEEVVALVLGPRRYPNNPVN